MQIVPPDADKLGLHDLAYWAIFLAVLAAWVLFILAPETERLGMLEERCQVLKSHLKAETRELARLQRSIKQLQQGNAQAWERAARGRLGWVEPGEITDLSRGLPPRQAGNNSDARKAEPALKPPPVLPRPAIPPLPVPPAIFRPQDLVSGGQAGAELLGPSCGSPPSPPPPQPPATALRLIQPQQVQPAAKNAPKADSLRLARRP